MKNLKNATVRIAGKDVNADLSYTNQGVITVIAPTDKDYRLVTAGSGWHVVELKGTTWHRRSPNFEEFDNALGLTHVNGVTVTRLSSNLLMLPARAVLERYPEPEDFLLADQLVDASDCVDNARAVYICDPTDKHREFIRFLEDGYTHLFQKAVEDLHAAAHILDARLDGSALCPAA